MSFKGEVLAVGETRWTSNAQRFATYDEAHGAVAALADRWFAVREYRVVESEDAVNYFFGEDERLTGHASPITEHPRYCEHCKSVQLDDEHDCPGQQDARSRWERSLEGKA